MNLKKKLVCLYRAITLASASAKQAPHAQQSTAEPLIRVSIQLCGQLQGPHPNRRTRLHSFSLKAMAKPKTRPTRREPKYAAIAKPVEVPAAETAAPVAPAPPPAAVDVRGRNVSGRPWKQPPKSRSSSLKMTQPRKSWDAKKKDREARQRAREKEAELVEARKERIAEQKRKTEEMRSRKRRNEFRNAQYQVITNDKTVKSLSKKKLRQIKRTRVAADGEVELVDAYAPMHGGPAKRVRGKK